MSITIKIDGLLSELIRGESIELKKSNTYVIHKILEEHYLRSTLIHRKLNYIIKHLTNGGEGVPLELIEEFDSVFAVPKVPLAEIQASKFESKRGKYVKKHKPQKDVVKHDTPTRKESVVNLFDVKNLDLFIKKE
jgi:hypothetical protein